MKWRVAVSLMVAVCGCSGGGDGGTGSDEPVSHAPLAGTVKGSPWTAGTAIALPGFDPGEMQVTVYEQGTEASCDDFGPLGDRELLATVPWTANSSYALGLQHNFTFSYPNDAGSFDNLVATRGRIELDDAPSAPDGGTASTTLRIRGEVDAQNSVEGQVPVTVCPGF